VEFESIQTRFVSVEYLVLLLLTSFRPKDKIRIQSLIGKTNKKLLLNLIKMFDNDENILHKRYQEILADT